MRGSVEGADRGKVLLATVGLVQLVQGLAILVASPARLEALVSHMSVSGTTSLGYAMVLGGAYLLIAGFVDEPPLVRRIGILLPVMNWLALAVSGFSAGEFVHSMVYVVLVTVVLSNEWFPVRASDPDATNPCLGSPKQRSM